VKFLVAFDLSSTLFGTAEERLTRGRLAIIAIADFGIKLAPRFIARLSVSACNRVSAAYPQLPRYARTHGRFFSRPPSTCYPQCRRWQRCTRISPNIKRSALLDQMNLDSVAHQSNSVGDCPQTDLAEEGES